MVHLDRTRSVGASEEQVELNHQLATVAHPKTERVGAVVVSAEGFAGCLVPHESAGPSFRRTEHVAVGETAAEHNHVHVVESLTTGHKVGHVHVFHVKACEIKRICHFTVAVHALLADDGGADAGTFRAVEGETAVGKAAFEVFGKEIFEWLLVEVVEALRCTFLARLDAVEKIGRCEPYTAHGIDGYKMYVVAMCDLNHTLIGRSRDGEVLHAFFVEKSFDTFLSGIVNLYYECGVFSEENLHEVGLSVHLESVGVEFQAAACAREEHFKKSGYKTSGAYVVHGKELAVAHKTLHGIESLGKSCRIFYVGSIGTDFRENL